MKYYKPGTIVYENNKMTFFFYVEIIIKKRDNLSYDVYSFYSNDFNSINKPCYCTLEDCESLEQL